MSSLARTAPLKSIAVLVMLVALTGCGDSGNLMVADYYDYKGSDAIRRPNQLGMLKATDEAGALAEIAPYDTAVAVTKSCKGLFTPEEERTILLVWWEKTKAMNAQGWEPLKNNLQNTAGVEQVAAAGQCATNPSIANFVTQMRPVLHQPAPLN